MKIPRIELLCFGSELLNGSVNTHAAHIGRRLREIGLLLTRESTLNDDRKEMTSALKEALHRSDVVISAGGLGPTFDDLTREAWSAALGRPLRHARWIVEDIEHKFRERGLRMPAVNRRQAGVLAGADVVENHFGTAPGQFLRWRGKMIFLLPGPARELLPMLESCVLPRLRERYRRFHIVQKTFHLTGVAESRVDERIRPLVAKFRRRNGCFITHGILASRAVIHVKFAVEGRDPERVRRAASSVAAAFRKRLGGIVFAEDGETMESVVVRRLRESRRTVAVAESCTGGLISKMLTDVPGASEVFHESAVVYTNLSKSRCLGVPAALLRRRGAVSREVARSMALGVRRTAGTDFGLSVTGIAGPDGGTPEKPVGLVIVGCASARRTVVREFRFSGDRSWIRLRSAMAALDLFRQELTGRRP